MRLEHRLRLLFQRATGRLPVALSFYPHSKKRKFQLEKILLSSGNLEDQTPVSTHLELEVPYYVYTKVEKTRKASL